MSDPSIPTPAAPGSENVPDVPVAVIGSGYWGRNLTRNFFRIGVLRAVCDANTTVLAEIECQFPGIVVTTRLDDILGRTDITAVAIATPAETHAGLIRKAFEAGKHVFVEKPFVLDEREGSDLEAEASSRGFTLMVGHILQYHPAFLVLKRMVDGGEFGKLNYIYSHRLNLGKFRREENILWSFAPHDISMILALAADPPESVLATGGSYLNSNIADVTTTHLTFPSGLRAHIFVSWLHPFKEQKMVVVGERKMMVFDDTRSWQEKLAVYPHEITWDGGLPVPNRAEPSYVPLPEQEPLLMECIHFLECVATGATPRTDANEGLRVLRVLNLSQKSMDEGSTKRFFDVENRSPSGY